MRLFFTKTVLPPLAALVLFASCSPEEKELPPSPPAEEETVIIQDIDITRGQTVFVPAYSEVYYTGNNTMKLAVTLTVHNTDFTYPIIVTSVRYYNAKGTMVREYLEKPHRLGPMATADFFVKSGEQSGGIGANFIVEWVSEHPAYEPVVETLMLSNTGTQGLSFTGAGRVIQHIETSR